MEAVEVAAAMEVVIAKEADTLAVVATPAAVVEDTLAAVVEDTPVVEVSLSFPDC